MWEQCAANNFYWAIIHFFLFSLFSCSRTKILIPQQYNFSVVTRDSWKIIIFLIFLFLFSSFRFLLTGQSLLCHSALTIQRCNGAAFDWILLDEPTRHHTNGGATTQHNTNKSHKRNHKNNSNIGRCCAAHLVDSRTRTCFRYSNKCINTIRLFTGFSFEKKKTDFLFYILYVYKRPPVCGQLNRTWNVNSHAQVLRFVSTWTIRIRRNSSAATTRTHKKLHSKLEKKNTHKIKPISQFICFVEKENGE